MTETKQNLSPAAFESLPPAIREWAASSQTTYLIMEINDRLGFKNEKIRIIPRLIYRLITQDIDPIDFTNELSHELNIGFQTAKSIAGDIEIKVLAPIETELKNGIGVDAKLIYFGQPFSKKPSFSSTGGASQDTNSVNKSDENKAGAVPLDNLEAGSPTIIKTENLNLTGPSTIEIKSQGAVEIIDHTKSKELTPTADQADQKETEPLAPFMIHQEDTLKPLMPQYTKENPDLKIDTKNYFPSKPAEPKPISIRLEIEGTQTPKARVVNYSDLRTPLNNIGAEKKQPPKKGDLVNLENFTKIKGNTVDLRKDE
ncbi:MAG: hypothetical protein Athens101426_594 [Parcubacteria group bacterium Athens1014_26]|nr:MAG: hypothetical protein Athens101426_594 [Parcubacteria group bacterium Athens1014_26]